MKTENNPQTEPDSKQASNSFYIKIMKDGPYLVYGKPPVDEQIIMPNDEDESWDYQKGKSYTTEQEPCALCRCGSSSNKPFCDGTHTHIDWKPEETASFEPLLEGAEIDEGPQLMLADNKIYCAIARFCDAKGDVWNIVEQADNQEQRDLAKREVAHCPSGRLVIWDKKNKKIHEPELDPSIGIIEDPGLKVSGPIWVRGGIRVESADGKSYEVRNRVTLCRCGGSSNKPFCDGTHVKIKWKA